MFIVIQWAVPGIIFLIGLGFQVSGFENVWVAYGFWGVAAVWILLILSPIKKRVPLIKGIKTKQGKHLRIEVQSCGVEDWIPQSKTAIGGHMSTLEVKAKFSPEGKIRLQSLKLHIGRHSFDAERIPIIVVDHEDTCFISFKVPSWVLTEYFNRPMKTYIRALTEDRDWLSNEFGIAITATVEPHSTFEERQRQNKLLVKLHQEYILSHDGISPRMMAGTALLPKEWVEKRLEEMGETWRRDKYYP